MPFISIKTNHQLTLRQENEITAQLGKLITILPNKKEENLMINLIDDQIMYFKGQDIPCVMVEVQLYKTIDFKYKKEFTEKVMEMIKETTNIESSNVYLNFLEYENWGKQGSLF